MKVHVPVWILSASSNLSKAVSPSTCVSNAQCGGKIHNPMLPHPRALGAIAVVDASVDPSLTRRKGRSKAQVAETCNTRQLRSRHEWMMTAVLRHYLRSLHYIFYGVCSITGPFASTHTGDRRPCKTCRCTCFGMLRRLTVGEAGGESGLDACIQLHLAAGSPTQDPVTTRGSPSLRQDSETSWQPDKRKLPATAVLTLGSTDIFAGDLR